MKKRQTYLEDENCWQVRTVKIVEKNYQKRINKLTTVNHIKFGKVFSLARKLT